MNNEEYLKQLADAEKNNKRTELEQARAASITGIEQEKASVLPTFQAAKQRTNVQSQIGAKNLAEFWARRGQTRQGISAQAESSRGNQLAGALGDIDIAKQSAITGFGQQTAQAGTDYQNALATGYGNIESGLATNLYDERIRLQQIEEAERIRLARAAETRSNQNRSIAASKTAATLAHERSLEKSSSKVLKGVLIPHDYAVKNQIKGIQTGENEFTYNVDGDQVKVRKGVNPFTGTTNPDAKNKETDDWDVFPNGYQPKNVKGKPVTSTKTKIDVNGQSQNVWKTPPVTIGAGLFDGKKRQIVSNYYFWDGANNKYWKLTTAEKKELGL